MTQPGIEPQSPGPLVNTLLIRPMAWSRVMIGNIYYAIYNVTLLELICICQKVLYKIFVPKVKDK